MILSVIENAVGAPGQFLALSWIAYEVFRLRQIVESVVSRTVELERKVISYGRPSVVTDRTTGNPP